MFENADSAVSSQCQIVRQSGRSGEPTDAGGRPRAPRGGRDGPDHPATAVVGPPLPAGAARPFPRRLPDQPVHGPRRAARPGAGAPAVAAPGRGAGGLRCRGRGARPAPGRPRHGLRDEPRARGQPTARSPRAAVAHAATPQRRMETDPRSWLVRRGAGCARRTSAATASAPHFEAGDAFAFGDALVVGYGPRTEELGLKHLATELGVRVRGLRITHPGMYHLDLAFCPLDDRAGDGLPVGVRRGLGRGGARLVPEPLVLTEEEALTTFCANSVVVGRTVVMPACPDRVRAQLEDWGFRVVAGRRRRVPQGRRLGPVPDQPAGRHRRARPAPAARRRGRPGPLTCGNLPPRPLHDVAQSGRRGRPDLLRCPTARSLWPRAEVLAYGVSP